VHTTFVTVVLEYLGSPLSNVLDFLQEETKIEQRRKNILVLILHYLTEEGYVVPFAMSMNTYISIY